MYWTLLGLVVLLPILALAAASALARRPANLGVQEGRLLDCPTSPNCVCSQAEDDGHRLAPFPLEGTADEAISRLKQVLAEMPRMKIVEETPVYLHVEATTRLFRFVDDLEFYVDEVAGVIHVRSASRVGHSDFGANRARVESIRQRLGH